MKYLLLTVLMSITVSVQASDLVWDDIAKVPAIKVKKELQSCDTKGWKVVLNQGKELSGEYICSQSGSWGMGGPQKEVKTMNPQEIADVHVGKVKAVGMMNNFEVHEKGTYTSEKKEMLLFYKN